ncbi:unnamed protein product, partial [Mesorhabditis spiculigera]
MADQSKRRKKTAKKKLSTNGGQTVATVAVASCEPVISRRVKKKKKVNNESGEGGSPDAPGMSVRGRPKKKLAAKAKPPEEELDFLPDHWRKATIDSAAEREMDAFVAFYAQQGVQGLRSEFAQCKSYVPPCFEYPTFTATKERNRYEDVVCLESTRVKLTLQVPPECGYIHANTVKMEGQEKTFIACQGPLEQTIGDHWRMVHQEGVTVIAALCQFLEAGKIKCSQYWPMKVDEFVNYGRMAVNTKKVTQDKLGFDVYTVEALPEGCSNSQIVKLIHMTSWPDRGVPAQPSVLLGLLKLIHFNAQGTIVVHCSAGIGRTGTVIAVDCIVSRLLKGKEARLLDVFKELRNARASSIQTESQYVFIVQVVFEFIQARTGDRHSSAIKRFNEDAKMM